MEWGEKVSYRRWLTEELSRRKRVNPAYSLRRFSGQLGISPASLSQILSGKRKLSPRMAASIAERMNLSPAERRAFIRAARGPVTTWDDDHDSDYRILEEDTFRLIADWYHYAILSLSEVRGTSSSREWIAARLGITRREATEAFDRLKRLGLIEERSGKFRQIARPLATRNTLDQAGIRSFLHQYLKKAETALEATSADESQFHTVVMAVDSKNLQKAKTLLQKFRRAVARLMEDGVRDRIYALSVQLYPIDKEAPLEATYH